MKYKNDIKYRMVYLDSIRRAVADYMKTEGCSCCQDIEGHERQQAVLAKLLHVPKYSDGSGYDFGRFRTEEETKVRVST